MHAFVVYLIFCMCWSLLNASPPLLSNFISQSTVVPSGRHGENDVLRFDTSTSKSNVSMKSGSISYGGLVVNNQLGNDFTKKMQLGAKRSSVELIETIVNTDFEINDVSAEIVSFYHEVLDILKWHLIDCLHVRNQGVTKITMFVQFKKFISIKQNLLNNSVALLHRSRLDITQLMRLYLFFCGPYLEPEHTQISKSLKMAMMYPEYNQRIRNIQHDIGEKFKDMLGDESTELTYCISTAEQLQDVKEKMEDKLLVLATRALKNMKPKTQLLPSTPFHCVCIDLLKWTALMKSENKDAVNIQDSKIIVENNSITIQRYAEILSYEIDIGNLDRLNYEVLLRVNKTFLSYLHKHFVLSTNLINTNIPALKAYDQKTISLVIARIYSIQPFLEIFNQLFVTRYLKLIGRLASQTKLTALINYTDRFKMIQDLGKVHAVQELQSRPVQTACDIKQLLNEFTLSFLQDLNVNESQKWINDVNGEVAKTPMDISLAIHANKNKAQVLMAICVKTLNPNWPNANNI